jgi:hypothetical protein
MLMMLVVFKQHAEWSLDITEWNLNFVSSPQIFDLNLLSVKVHQLTPKFFMSINIEYLILWSKGN